MPVKRVVLAVAMLAGLSACAPKTQVHDVPLNEATWLSGRRTIAEGSRLKMVFDKDREALGIDRVDYKVYDGELYLWPVRASESFVPVEFTLDIASMKLRAPWAEHVYWVEAANWNNMVGRIVHPSPLGEKVDRVKAEVTSSAD